MRHKTANKALSLLLTLCMVMGILPTMSVTAEAAGGTEPRIVIIDEPADT